MVQQHKRKAKNSDYIIYFEKKLQIRKRAYKLSCKPLNFGYLVHVPLLRLSVFQYVDRFCSITCVGIIIPATPL